MWVSRLYINFTSNISWLQCVFREAVAVAGQKRGRARQSHEGIAELGLRIKILWHQSQTHLVSTVRSNSCLIINTCQLLSGHRMASSAPSQTSEDGRVSSQRSQRSWSHSPLLRTYKVASRLPESSLPLQFAQEETRSCHKSLCRLKRRRFRFGSQTTAALNCRESSQRNLRVEKLSKTTEESSQMPVAPTSSHQRVQRTYLLAIKGPPQFSQRKVFFLSFRVFPKSIFFIKLKIASGSDDSTNLVVSRNLACLVVTRVNSLSVVISQISVNRQVQEKYELQTARPQVNKRGNSLRTDPFYPFESFFKSFSKK